MNARKQRKSCEKPGVQRCLNYLGISVNPNLEVLGQNQGKTVK